MIEIERKYLVKNNSFLKTYSTKSIIKQGYLSSVPERTVRVRIKNNQGFLTIKGKSNTTGTTRFEWEKEIDLHEAEQLLLLCEKGVINKTRYEVKWENFVIEIDEFHNENQGLVIAEIELENESIAINIPDFLGDEVTNNKKYYNAYISQNPYSTWKK